MIEWLKSRFYNNQVGITMKLFNVVHIVVLFCMTIACHLLKEYFMHPIVLYITVGTTALFLLTLLEGNRTGDTTKCVTAMSIFFNLFYLPFVFFSYDKFVWVVPIYFMFGIIYTLLLLDMKKAVILSSVEAVVYIVILLYNRAKMNIDVDTLSSDDRQNIYFAACIATILCGICAGAAVRFRYLVYKKEQENAEELNAIALDEYIAKDMFLMNMSHEIRTPMNAIVGNVDLLLDQDIDNHVRDNAYNILNSCNALLSITDELMDLSKTESQEIVIYHMKYDFLDLIKEIINMIAVRLMESPLEFNVEINKNIPRQIYGDASKIRQVLINILNNAIKYTEEGSILLSVDMDMQSGDDFDLCIKVSDTGIGIKDEDLENLFSNNKSNDSYEDDNSPGESSGLGLKICKEIINEMGGEISAESTFGVGSTFSLRIPQKGNSTELLVSEIKDENQNIVYLEPNLQYQNRVAKIFEDLNVACKFVNDRKELETLANSETFSHIFVDSVCYKECESFLKSRIGKEEIVVSAGIADNLNSVGFATILIRPIHILNVADVLNHVSTSYVRQVISRGGFVIPSCTIMVVDDNFTNLNVASAILKKYEANVITASSGKECLRLLEDTDVDMIFLDYMMPEMNGIDTLGCIRKLPHPKYKELPVVALTANVVSGAREMFIEAGFNDFIPKPIVVDKIEKSMRAFLPKELIVYKNEYEQ